MILIPHRLVGHITDDALGESFELSNVFMYGTWLDEVRRDRTAYYLLWNERFCFGVMLLDLPWRR